MKNNKKQEYVKIVLTLIMSLLLILFAQWIKLLKNPKSTPITKETLAGLIILGIFSVLGIFIHSFVQKLPVKIIKEFPILGWVSMVSLAGCLIFPKVITAINSVDFLSITTPILTYAGISIADRLGDLRKVSWKIVIVGVFVFLGTYLGSAVLAQIGFLLSGR
ncbi:MAG: hypothetical protein Q4D53_03245 [Leptotrichiaceae bacterium]|nr:hypothetical protein [Leptotrichiaceae bacterium]